ncbi:MAG: hypothetical protein CVU81_00195 [Euryarchaeota archaeon HGW-Euryarchaeota-1]|nr:MAG: hypothetical protein CVU81_00195 [Euryarchaeota archaeon HGW-Euryarchaeota-1]
MKTHNKTLMFGALFLTLLVLSPIFASQNESDNSSFPSNNSPPDNSSFPSNNSTSDNISQNNLQKQLPVNIYFFYKTGCVHCAAVKPTVHEICAQCTVSLHELNIYYNQTNIDLLFDFGKRYCIPDDKLGVPVIFAGKNVLVGDKEISENLKNALSDALYENINPLGYQKQCNISNTNTSNHTDLTWFAVIIASAFDSINPCAIGVLLIFLSFLTLSHVFSRKKILLYGMLYISAIYITYLAAGLGLLQLLRGLDLFYLISFQVAVIFILVVTAFFEFRDAYIAITQTGKPLLAISDKVKPLLQKWMKKGTLGATIILGCLVALFELPCTGHVYLGILAKLSGVDIFQGLLYLLVYNFIFVLPLIVILLLFFMGKTNIEKLVAEKSKISWLSRYAIAWIVLMLATLLANDVIKQINLMPTNIMVGMDALSIYIWTVLLLVAVFVIVALTRQIISKYMKVCALCFALILGILVLSILFFLGTEIPTLLLAGLLGMLCTGIWYELKKLNFKFFGVFTIFWIFEVVALSYALFVKDNLIYALLLIIVFAAIGVIQLKDQEARALNLKNNALKKNVSKQEIKKGLTKNTEVCSLSVPSPTKIGDALDHCCD